MATTQYESPIPIENGRQVEVIVTSALSIIVPCIFVGLRIFAKVAKTTKPLDFTELGVAVALIVCIGLHIDYFLLVCKGGMGFHATDIISRFGPDVLVFFGKAIVSVGCMYNLAVYTCKIPVLIMYTTLIPAREMTLAVRCLAVLFTLSYLSTAIAPFLLCRPLAYNWDKTIEGGTCGNWPLYYEFCGALNIVYEALVLILPMPFFFKLQMPLDRKLILIGMFGIGFATCIIGIYRQTTIPGLDFNDMTYEGIGATVFSGLEPPVAICLSCVPFLKPLFRKRFGSTNNTTGYGSHEASSGGKLRSIQTSSRPFKELEDDSSEVELRPKGLSSAVTVEPSNKNQSSWLRDGNDPDTITMERRWEVKTEHRGKAS